jgi:hypothetical protein
MQRTADYNMDKFDCRNYIIPGDTIYYRGARCYNEGENLLDDITFARSSAVVIAVYEKFVVVKLTRVVEYVSRWDIIKVNDINLGNEAGYFGNLKRRK